MASFLNTGVLGQQVGSSLQVGSLRGEFTSFRDEVLANKKRRRTTSRADIKQEEQFLSAADKARKGEVTASKATVAAQEKEALKIKRNKQLAESEKTTGVKGGVDTSDIRPTGPGADKMKGITKVGKDVTPVSPAKLSPETSNITDADKEFAETLKNWDTFIQGKNSTQIKRQRVDTQWFIRDVSEKARATGRKGVIDASMSIEKLLGGASPFSEQTVGATKAATTKAIGAIRGELDIERILADLKNNPIQNRSLTVKQKAYGVGGGTGKVAQTSMSQLQVRPRSFGGRL